MRYWYDTEFIEDGRTIDLISIGVVAEDGREFYAQNRQCEFRRASEWVARNVLVHLDEYSMMNHEPFSSHGIVWRNKTQIATDLRSFLDPDVWGKPELWGYYSAYDHVVLCQLYGTMMQLPSGFPMWTRDIKQLCWSLGDPALPKQGKGMHNALADARWTKEAWEFLMTLKGTEAPTVKGGE